MSTLAIVGMMVLGVGGFAGLLFWAAQKRAKQAGVLEERNAETQRTLEAKRKADAVLSEHRDPDAVDDRLRDGSF